MTNDWVYFIVYVPDPHVKIDHMVSARSNIANPAFIQVSVYPTKDFVFTLCGQSIARPDHEAYNINKQPICWMCIESQNEPLPHTFATQELTAAGIE